MRITDNYLKTALPDKDKKVKSIRLETNLSVQIKYTKKGVTRSFVFRSVLLNGKTLTEYLGSVNDLTIAEARQMAEERRKIIAQGYRPKEYIKSELNRRMTENQRKNKTVQDLIDLFMRTKNDLAIGTKKRYIERFKALAPVLKESAQDFLKSDFCLKAIQQMVSDGHKAKAQHFLLAVRQMAEVAIDYNLIDKNPFLRLHRLIPALNSQHFASVDPDNIESDLLIVFKFVFSKKVFPWLRYFFLLGILTLLRPKEVMLLKKANFNAAKHSLKVEHTKTLKNGFTIYTNEYLDKYLAYLIKYSDSAKFINLSVLTYRSLNERFRKNKIHFTAHGWRSAGMSWLVQNGTSIEVANAILSHKFADTVTRAYLRTDLPEERKEALEKWDRFIFDILKRVDSELYSSIIL